MSGISATSPLTTGMVTQSSLTGDALMTYLSVRLNDIDSSMGDYMKDQEMRLEQKEMLNRARSVQSEIASVRSGHYDLDALVKRLSDAKVLTDGGNNGYDAEDIIGALRDEFAGTMATYSFDQALAPYASDLVQQVRTGDYSSEESIKRELAKLDSQVESLDKGMELQMIQIQQMMSQRQTAVQLITNILGKFNDTTSAIVQNIK